MRAELSGEVHRLSAGAVTNEFTPENAALGRRIVGDAVRQGRGRARLVASEKLLADRDDFAVGEGDTARGRPGLAKLGFQGGHLVL